MNRADLRIYLAGRFSTLLSQADMLGLDLPGNLTEPLDAAFLTLGVAYADLATASVADADAAKARAVGAYETLLAIQEATATTHVGKSISMADPTVSKSTTRDGFLNLDALIERAKKACAAAGVSVGGSSWAAPVDLNLDILEPSLCQS